MSNDKGQAAVSESKTQALEATRYYARNGQFYECDKDGNPVYEDIPVPNSTATMSAQRMRFFDSPRHAFVSAEDYDTLRAERDALKASNAALVEALEGLLSKTPINANRDPRVKAARALLASVKS